MALSHYPAVTVPISIRFSDLDAYGHVNNSVFFTYLEEARIELIREHFRVEMSEETVFLVARAACSYKLPVEYGTDLFVTMTVREIKRASFVIDYVMADAGGATYATAETTLVAFDPVSRSVTSLPSWLDSAVEAAAEKWGGAAPVHDSAQPPPSR